MTIIKIKTIQDTQVPTGLQPGELALGVTTGELYFSHEGATKQFKGVEYPTVSQSSIATGTDAIPSVFRLTDLVKTVKDMYLPPSGGSMLGEINMGNKLFLNIPAPTEDNHPATKAYTDPLDFKNMPPMAGYSELERQVPIVGDYGFASVFHCPVFGYDSNDREVMYYTTKTPLSYYNTYVGYRHTTNDPFTILPNPLSHPTLGAGEYIHMISTMGDDFISLVTANETTNAPMRRLIFLTQGSIDTSKWTLAYQTPHINFESITMVKRGSERRIMRMKFPTDVEALVQIESLTGEILKSQVIFSRSETAVLPETTTGVTIYPKYYLQPLGSLSAPIYDSNTGKFVWSTSYYCVYRNNGGVSSNAGLITIPGYLNPEWVFGSGVSNFRNNMPLVSGSCRYALNWGVAGNTTYIWGTTPCYSMCKNVLFLGWRVYTQSISAIYANMGDFNKITNIIDVNGSGVDSIMPKTVTNINIHSPVYWAKIININAGWLDNGVINVRNTTGATDPAITTSFSRTSFGTIFEPNDMLLLNSSNVGKFSTAISSDTKSELELVDSGMGSTMGNMRFICVVVNTTNNTSKRYAVVPNKKVWEINGVGDKYQYTEIVHNGSVFVPPPLPSGYVITNSVGGGIGSVTWNGELEAATFYYLCDVSTNPNTTGYVLLKGSRPNSSTAYTWTVVRTDMMAPVIKMSQNSRGETSKRPSTTIGGTMLSGSYLYYLASCPLSGDTIPIVIRYDLSSATSTPSYSGLVSWYTSTSQYGAHGLGEGYSPPPWDIGHSDDFGFYAIVSGNSNLSNAIISSRDIATGESTTEENWWNGTKRYTKWVIASPNTGMVVYVQECPIFIGGYMTTVQAAALDLVPNSTYYLYVNAPATRWNKATVTTASSRSVDTNSTVCIGKVTTDTLQILSIEYYATAGFEGLINDLKSQVAAIKAAR